MERNYKGLQNGSDVRGIALEGVEGENVNLTPEVAEHFGFAFASWLAERGNTSCKNLRVAVGRDSRLSGPDLAEAFMEGVASTGATVLDCGMATTPAMFMSCIFDETRADGACMVTASHLPFNRNGLKYFSRDGGLESSDIKRLVAMAEADHSVSPELETAEREHPDLVGLYAAHLRRIITDALAEGAEDPERPLYGLKIAVDAGNGAGGFYATKVLEPLGADISSSRYLDPDGSFPNHIPNPENAEAMESIREATLEGGCDLGLIFDTDVDRSSAVDEQGDEINRNKIVALAAALAADTHPGTTVVTDSVTSNELTVFLEEELGVHHLRYQRGYRNVINKMLELNREGTPCALAIETSGHAAYFENYALDDGSYLATRIVVKVAQLLREGRSISELLAGLAEPAESREVRFPIAGENFGEVGEKALADVEAKVREKGAEMAEQVFGAGTEVKVVEPNYEGVRVAFSGDVDGWFLLRKSLHDPLMPLNMESAREGGLALIEQFVRECVADLEGVDTSAV